MSKLRVWWVPQVGMKTPFYVPVNTPEEGKVFLDVLSAYDTFQFMHSIKGGHCNFGGIQMLCEDTSEWVEWETTIENTYYDNIEVYCSSDNCVIKQEMKEFNEQIYRLNSPFMAVFLMD